MRRQPEEVVESQAAVAQQQAPVARPIDEEAAFRVQLVLFAVDLLALIVAVILTYGAAQAFLNVVLHK